MPSDLRIREQILKASSVGAAEALYEKYLTSDASTSTKNKWAKALKLRQARKES